ncbi:MAG: transcription antitermination factor NusB [Fimbriimonadaceae bacterium]|nr:transcription antitermination factor NusB [Fimbriimonadaceae bacterium]QYK56189.1 MAG: transcription antitermination factor NusB [Fimbriimonadaceae bacterium]
MKSEAAPIRSRRFARRAAFQALYAVTIGMAEPEDALATALDGAELAPETSEFCRDVFLRAATAPDEFTDLFKPHLAAGWALDRLAVTDKLLCLLACVELWHRPEVPPKVTLDEYVELAKRFGSETSHRFVNGVLANVLRDSPKADWSGPPVEPEVEEPGPAEEAEPGPEQEAEQEELHQVGQWIIRQPQPLAEADEPAEPS